MPASGFAIDETASYGRRSRGFDARAGERARLSVSAQSELPFHPDRQSTIKWLRCATLSIVLLVVIMRLLYGQQWDADQLEQFWIAELPSKCADTAQASSCRNKCNTAFGRYDQPHTVHVTMHCVLFHVAANHVHLLRQATLFRILRPM